MTAADGKRGHRFRTNLANRATRHGEAGSSTAGAIRAVRGGVTSSGIAATLFYNPRRPRCSIPSHRTVTPTISTLCPALGQILAGFLPEARTGAREAAARMKDLAERFAELRNAIMRLPGNPSRDDRGGLRHQLFHLEHTLMSARGSLDDVIIAIMDANDAAT